MSNSRQFLVPINYDITKPVYKPDEDVRKRQYIMDDVISPQQLKQLDAVLAANSISLSSRTYADKLRNGGKY